LIFHLTPENLKESNRKDSEEQLEFRPDTLAVRMGGRDFKIPYDSIDQIMLYNDKETGFIDSINVYSERDKCKGELPPPGTGLERVGNDRFFIFLVGFQEMELIASELQKRVKNMCQL